MLGNIYTEISRDAWGFVPGHKIKPTYNAAGKPTQIDYCEGDTVIFTQILKYDANNNMIELECIAPSS